MVLPEGLGLFHLHIKLEKDSLRVDFLNQVSLLDFRLNLLDQ
jgi:hypothetical protein